MENHPNHSPQVISILRPDLWTVLELPIGITGVSCGFPSPGEDFLDTIDLNQYLIKDKEATFLARVEGNSMIGAGIEEGDLLMIDKSIEPKHGHIVVCFIDGEFTVKRIEIQNDTLWLVPENDNYKPVEVTPDNDFLVWGVKKVEFGAKVNKLQLNGINFTEHISFDAFNEGIRYRSTIYKTQGLTKVKNYVSECCRSDLSCAAQNNSL